VHYLSEFRVSIPVRVEGRRRKRRRRGMSDVPLSAQLGS